MIFSYFGPEGRKRQLRRELAGGFLAAVVPYAALFWYLPTDEKHGVLSLSFAGCLAAVLTGIWILRGVSRYPGVEAIASVLTSFSATFSILILIFVLGRLDYSRILLVGSYVLAVGWFYFASAREDSRIGLRIGIVRWAANGLPEGVSRIAWVPLDSTDTDGLMLDAVAVDLRADLPEEWERRLTDFALEGIPVFHIKHLLESLTGRLELEHLSENSFGTLSPLSIFMSIKYVVDWITAAIVGFIALPGFLVIALLVRLDSPGPVLFRQWRVGYRGRPFSVFKFRTMIASEPSMSSDERHAAKTQQGDARVTRFGAFLRRTRIDELPQILNILRGEMSWIGPRPEAEVLSRWYETEIPFYRYRHIVRPGITGWAQVNQGHVVEMAEVTSKLHYDFYYIKNFGMWIDTLIIVRTVKIVFSGYGAK